MDNLPNPSPSPSELSELQTQYNHLQQLVASLLLVVLVISGTLTIYLLRQWRFVQGELDAVTPQATQLLSEHSNNYVMMQDLVKKLAEYGRNHPDFEPIANKYRLNDLLPKPGTASITSSLPVPATSKK